MDSGHRRTGGAGVARSAAKKSVIVATKAGNDFYNASSADDKGFGRSAKPTIRNISCSRAEQSLKALGIEALDVLKLHTENTELYSNATIRGRRLDCSNPGENYHTTGWSVQSFQETTQAHILDQHLRPA
jgi:aryl-alcohol dehydrogenase-like predicted oxidoreductase